MTQRKTYFQHTANVIRESGIDTLLLKYIFRNSFSDAKMPLFAFDHFHEPGPFYIIVKDLL